MYNSELVAASLNAGARYRYFWQGGNPWCQTLSARWLRKRAKGEEDWVVNALAPLGEIPKMKNLGKFEGNPVLSNTASWVPKTAEFSINPVGHVLVADAHFTEKVNAKVNDIKNKICWILQRVDADLRNQVHRIRIPTFAFRANPKVGQVARAAAGRRRILDFHYSQKLG